MAPLVAGLLACSSPSAHALLINFHFAGAFERSVIDSRGRFAAEPSSRLRGGGTVQGVFEAAGDFWSGLLHDDRTFNITVGWVDTLPSGAIAAAAPINDLGNEIGLSTRFTHFADTTPLLNEEFGDYREATSDLGGGLLNTGRGYFSMLDPSLGIDLFSTALHEIGHVLGNAFDRLGISPAFPIDEGPYAGTRLPCVSDGFCGHLGLADALMNPTGGRAMRTMVSDADLLFVASDGHFKDTVLSAHELPEPAAPALLALVAMALVRRRR